MNLLNVLITLLITLLFIPQTAHAYLVPLLGGAGAMASFVIVIIIITFIFCFFIWYNARKIYRKIIQKPTAKLETSLSNNKHLKCPSLLARFIFNHRDFWLYLGNKESKLHRKILAKTEIKQPIYITGLARSGTTILLETLANSPQIATQKYRDFPFVFTPYMWTKALILLDKILPKSKKKERSHQDGLMVNAKSPEAMEEPIWMAYFKEIHKADKINIIAADNRNKEFEYFYHNHIKKITAAQKKERYLSKGNYNLTRTNYIQKLYPDAKIIIMVRHPENHIYSLIKQHKIFKTEHHKNPKTLTHMNMLGHFEFGNNIIPINVGQSNLTEIVELLKSGDDVKAMSKYWASIYDYVKKIVADNKDNLLLIRYEDLCDNSKETISKIHKFCNLEQENNNFQESIKQPTYYKVDFNQNELKIIESETKKVAEYFGY
jgi:hypothetical protein